MRIAAAAAAAVCAAALAAAPAARAADRRGQHDLLFGVGALTSQEATIFADDSLDAEDGTTFTFRYRYHFTNTVGIEADFTFEDGGIELKFDNDPVDSVDADTSFFSISFLFYFTQTAVAPYLVAGVGRYDHQAEGLLVPDPDFPGTFLIADFEEDGPVFDVGLGVDGRTDGRLIWAADLRLLNYDFQGFREDWNRYHFSAQIGVRF